MEMKIETKSAFCIKTKLSIAVVLSVVFQEFVRILPRGAQVPPPGHQLLNQGSVRVGGIPIMGDGNNGNAVFLIEALQ